MSKIIFLTLFVFFGISYINANYIIKSNHIEIGKRLLIKDERYIEALRFFTLELKSASITKQDVVIVENIYWIAECLFQIRQIKQLEIVLKIGKNLAKKNPDSRVYKDLLLIEAKYLIDMGRNKAAIQLLLNLENKNTDEIILCKTRLILADVYYRTNQLDKSKQQYEFIIKNAKDSIQLAQAYTGIGNYFFMISDFDTATICYNKSLEFYTKTIGPFCTKSASVMYNLGLIANKNSDYETSENKMLKALNIYLSKFGNCHPKTAEAYGTLGSIYTMKEDIGKAVYYSIKEIDILEKLYGKENEKLIYGHLNLGKIYTITKEFSKAETEIRNALLLVKNFYGKKCNLYTQCIVKLSVILAEKRDFLQAKKLLKEVIDINKKNPDDYIPDAYHQLGYIFLQQKEFDNAVSYFQQANKMYIDFFGNKNIYSIDPLTELSNIYLQQKKLPEALKYANLALMQTIDSNHIIYPYDHWECILQILKCKKKWHRYHLSPLEDIKADIELIKQTIKEANTIKQTYYSNGSQAHYADKMSELNETGIYYLTHFYKKTDTYFMDNLLLFAENNKANLLRHRITIKASNESLPKAEQDKLATITNRLNHFIALNENQEDANFNINDSVLFYQNLYENFVEVIEKNYPKIYTIKYGQKPFTVRQIQKRLKNNYSFLIYCNDGENYYCLSISATQIIYKICGNKQKIDSIVRPYQSTIIDKRFDSKTSLELSQSILPKTLEKNLLISSDAMLQNISFDILFDNQTADYLILKHTIQHAFSASTYFNHSSVAQYKDIIAFFPNFLHTDYAVLNSKKEQKSLSAFPNYVNFSNSMAIKKSFIKKCNTAKIIHIASHLVIDTVYPLESSLVFQPSNDYLLTINEIWKLNINAQLITLAACQSNYGKSQNGEGIQNFAWAFQYAGAHNILSTQWNASDKSTASIISDFYKNLKAGKPKQEALQSAKINYLKNTDAIGAQPFFWANYTLFADETDVNVASNCFYNLWQWIISFKEIF